MNWYRHHIGLYLSVFSVLMATIETYKYPGFIFKHFNFLPMIFYVITGIAIIAIKLYPPPTPEKSLLAITFRLLAIYATILTGIFYIIETITYPNFIFTYLHIHLDGLQILTGMLFVYFALSNLMHKHYVAILNSTFFLAISSLLINYAIINTLDVTKLIKKEVEAMQSPAQSDDEKNEVGWGTIYQYAKMLKNATPEDAIIAMPPAQNHWLYSGNIVLMRYFLYPRTLVNVKETANTSTLHELPSQNYDYVALVWGESNERDQSPYGWPKTSIDAEYIDYFDLNTNTTNRVVTTQYQFRELNEQLWGVIKVRKGESQ